MPRPLGAPCREPSKSRSGAEQAPAAGDREKEAPVPAARRLRAGGGDASRKGAGFLRPRPPAGAGEPRGPLARFRRRPLFSRDSGLTLVPLRSCLARVLRRLGCAVGVALSTWVGVPAAATWVDPLKPGQGRSCFKLPFGRVLPGQEFWDW